MQIKKMVSERIKNTKKRKKYEVVSFGPMFLPIYFQVHMSKVKAYTV